MKSFLILFSLLNFCFLNALALEEQETQVVEKAKPQIMNGVVNSRRLNVRIRPTKEHEVVAIVAKGDNVRIVSDRIKDWFEIELPNNSNVWVFKNDINEDGIILNKITPRSGAGVVYNPYSVNLEKGTKVQIVDTKNDWAKIKVEGVTLTAWVASEFVTTEKQEEEARIAKEKAQAELELKAKQEAEQKALAIKKQEEIKAQQLLEKENQEKLAQEKIKAQKEAEKAAKLAEKKAKPRPLRSKQEGTGRDVWRGYVYRLSTPKGIATHQLIAHYANGKKGRIGYLSSAHAFITLDSWVDRPVIIYGKLSTKKIGKESILEVSGIQIEIE